MVLVRPCRMLRSRLPRASIFSCSVLLFPLPPFFNVFLPQKCFRSLLPTDTQAEYKRNIYIYKYIYIYIYINLHPKHTTEALTSYRWVKWFLSLSICFFSSGGCVLRSKNITPLVPPYSIRSLLPLPGRVSISSSILLLNPFPFEQTLLIPGEPSSSTKQQHKNIQQQQQRAASVSKKANNNNNRTTTTTKSADTAPRSIRSHKLVNHNNNNNKKEHEDRDKRHSESETETSHQHAPNSFDHIKKGNMETRNPSATAPPRPGPCNRFTLFRQTPALPETRLRPHFQRELYDASFPWEQIDYILVRYRLDHNTAFTLDYACTELHYGKSGPTYALSVLLLPEGSCERGAACVATPENILFQSIACPRTNLGRQITASEILLTLCPRYVRYLLKNPDTNRIVFPAPINTRDNVFELNGQTLMEQAMELLSAAQTTRPAAEVRRYVSPDADWTKYAGQDKTLTPEFEALMAAKRACWDGPSATGTAFTWSLENALAPRHADAAADVPGYKRFGFRFQLYSSAAGAVVASEASEYEGEPVTRVIYRGLLRAAAELRCSGLMKDLWKEFVLTLAPPFMKSAAECATFYFEAFFGRRTGERTCWQHTVELNLEACGHSCADGSGAAAAVRLLCCPSEDPEVDSSSAAVMSGVECFSFVTATWVNVFDAQRAKTEAAMRPLRQYEGHRRAMDLLRKPCAETVWPFRWPDEPETRYITLDDIETSPPGNADWEMAPATEENAAPEFPLWRDLYGRLPPLFATVRQIDESKESPDWMERVKRASFPWEPIDLLWNVHQKQFRHEYKLQNDAYELRFGRAAPLHTRFSYLQNPETGDTVVLTRSYAAPNSSVVRQVVASQLLLSLLPDFAMAVMDQNIQNRVLYQRPLNTRDNVFELNGQTLMEQAMELLSAAQTTRPAAEVRRYVSPDADWTKYAGQDKTLTPEFEALMAAKRACWDGPSATGTAFTWSLENALAPRHVDAAADVPGYKRFGFRFHICCSAALCGEVEEPSDAADPLRLEGAAGAVVASEASEYEGEPVTRVIYRGLLRAAAELRCSGLMKDLWKEFVLTLAPPYLNVPHEFMTFYFDAFFGRSNCNLEQLQGQPSTTVLKDVAAGLRGKLCEVQLMLNLEQCGHFKALNVRLIHEEQSTMVSLVRCGGAKKSAALSQAVLRAGASCFSFAASELQRYVSWYQREWQGPGSQGRYLESMKRVVECFSQMEPPLPAWLTWDWCDECSEGTRETAALVTPADCGIVDRVYATVVGQELTERNAGDDLRPATRVGASLLAGLFAPDYQATLGCFDCVAVTPDTDPVNETPATMDVGPQPAPAVGQLGPRKKWFRTRSTRLPVEQRYYVVWLSVWDSPMQADETGGKEVFFLHQRGTTRDAAMWGLLRKALVIATSYRRMLGEMHLAEGEMQFRVAQTPPHIHTHTHTHTHISTTTFLMLHIRGRKTVFNSLQRQRNSDGGGWNSVPLSLNTERSASLDIYMVTRNPSATAPPRPGPCNRFTLLRQTPALPETRLRPHFQRELYDVSFPWEQIDYILVRYQLDHNTAFTLDYACTELHYGKSGPTYALSVLLLPEGSCERGAACVATPENILFQSIACPRTNLGRQITVSEILLTLCPRYVRYLLKNPDTNRIVFPAPINTRDNVFELNGQTLMEQAMELLSAAQTTRPAAEVRRYVSPDADWTKYAGQDKTLTPEFEALMAAKRACWDGPSATGTAFTWSLENALAPRHADAAADVPGYKRFGFRFQLYSSAAGAVVASEASEYEGEPVTRVIYRGLLRAAAELRCSGLMKDLWKEFVLTLAPPFMKSAAECATFYFEAFFGRRVLGGGAAVAAVCVVGVVAAQQQTGERTCWQHTVELNLEACGHSCADGSGAAAAVRLLCCPSEDPEVDSSSAAVMSGVECFSFVTATWVNVFDAQRAKTEAAMRPLRQYEGHRRAMDLLRKPCAETVWPFRWPDEPETRYITLDDIETSPPGNADWEVAPAAAPEFPLWRDLYGRLPPLFATVRQIDESKESPDWMERVKRASFPREPIDLLWNVHQKQFRHEYKLQNDAYELRFGRAAPLHTRFSYLQNPETGDTVALTRSYAAPNSSVVRQVVASQLLLSLLPDFAMAVMDQNIQNRVLYQRPLNTRDNVFELNGQTLMEQAMELLSAAQTTRPAAEVRRYVSPDADWTKYAGQDKTLTPEFEALMAAKRACWDGPSATGTAFTWSLENALAPRHADAAADVPGYKRFGFRFHICCSAALCGEVEEPSDAADPLRLEGAAGAVVASEASEYEGEPVTRVIYRGLLRAAAELRCSGLMKDLWKEFVLTLAPPHLNVPHEFMTFYFDAFFGRSNCNLEQLQGQPSTTVLKDVAESLRGKLCEVLLMLNLEQCGHFKALNLRLIHEEQSTMVSLVRCGGAKKSAAFSQAVLRAGASCFSFAASELQRYVSWYQREWQGPGSQGRYLESMKRVVECFSQMEPPLPAWLTWDWCDEETAALVTPADCGIVDRVYATVVGQELTERNAGDDLRPATRVGASLLAGLFAPDYQATLGCFDCVAVTPDTDPANETPATMDVGPQPAPAVGQLGPRKKRSRTRSTRLPVEQRYYVVWLSVWDSPMQADETGGKEVFFLHQRGTTRDAAMWGLLRKALVIATSYRRMLGETVHLRRCMPPPASNGASAGADSSAELLDRAAASWGCHAVLQRMSCDSLGPWATAVEDGSRPFLDPFAHEPDLFALFIYFFLWLELLLSQFFLSLFFFGCVCGSLLMLGSTLSWSVPDSPHLWLIPRDAATRLREIQWIPSHSGAGADSESTAILSGQLNDKNKIKTTNKQTEIKKQTEEKAGKASITAIRLPWERGEPPTDAVRGQNGAPHDTSRWIRATDDPKENIRCIGRHIYRSHRQCCITVHIIFGYMLCTALRIGMILEIRYRSWRQRVFPQIVKRERERVREPKANVRASSSFRHAKSGVVQLNAISSPQKKYIGLLSALFFCPYSLSLPLSFFLFVIAMYEMDTFFFLGCRLYSFASYSLSLLRFKFFSMKGPTKAISVYETEAQISPLTPLPGLLQRLGQSPPEAETDKKSLTQQSFPWGLVDFLWSTSLAGKVGPIRCLATEVRFGSAPAFYVGSAVVDTRMTRTVAPGTDVSACSVLARTPGFRSISTMRQALVSQLLFLLCPSMAAETARQQQVQRCVYHSVINTRDNVFELNGQTLMEQAMELLSAAQTTRPTAEVRRYVSPDADWTKYAGQDKTLTPEFEALMAAKRACWDGPSATGTAFTWSLENALAPRHADAAADVPGYKRFGFRFQLYSSAAGAVVASEASEYEGEPVTRVIYRGLLRAAAELRCSGLMKDLWKEFSLTCGPPYLNAPYEYMKFYFDACFGVRPPPNKTFEAVYTGDTAGDPSGWRYVEKLNLANCGHAYTGGRELLVNLWEVEDTKKTKAIATCLTVSGVEFFSFVLAEHVLAMESETSAQQLQRMEHFMRCEDVLSPVVSEAGAAYVWSLEEEEGEDPTTEVESPGLSLLPSGSPASCDVAVPFDTDAVSLNDIGVFLGDLDGQWAARCRDPSSSVSTYTVVVNQSDGRGDPSVGAAVGIVTNELDGMEALCRASRAMWGKGKGVPSQRRAMDAANDARDEEQRLLAITEESPSSPLVCREDPSSRPLNGRVVAGPTDGILSGYFQPVALTSTSRVALLTLQTALKPFFDLHAHAERRLQVRCRTTSSNNNNRLEMGERQIWIVAMLRFQPTKRRGTTRTTETAATDNSSTQKGMRLPCEGDDEEALQASNRRHEHLVGTWGRRNEETADISGEAPPRPSLAFEGCGPTLEVAVQRAWAKAVVVAASYVQMLLEETTYPSAPRNISGKCEPSRSYGRDPLVQDEFDFFFHTQQQNNNNNNNKKTTTNSNNNNKKNKKMRQIFQFRRTLIIETRRMDAYQCNTFNIYIHLSMYLFFIQTPSIDKIRKKNSVPLSLNTERSASLDIYMVTRNPSATAPPRPGPCNRFTLLRQTPALPETRLPPHFQRELYDVRFPWEQIDYILVRYRLDHNTAFTLDYACTELHYGKSGPTYALSVLLLPEGSCERGAACVATPENILFQSIACPRINLGRQITVSEILLTLCPRYVRYLLKNPDTNRIVFPAPINTRDNVFELNGQTLMEQAMELLSAAQTTRPTAEVRRYVSPDADWTKYAGQDKTLTPEFEALMAAKRACWDGPSATGTAFTWSLENALAPRHADAAADVPGYKRFGFRFQLYSSAAGAVVASEASEYEGEPVTRVIYRGLLRAAAELRCSGLMKDLWKEFVLTLAPPFMKSAAECATFYFEAFFGRRVLGGGAAVAAVCVVGVVAAQQQTGERTCWQHTVELNLEACGHSCADGSGAAAAVRLLCCPSEDPEVDSSSAAVMSGVECFSFVTATWRAKTEAAMRPLRQYEGHRRAMDLLRKPCAETVWPFRWPDEPETRYITLDDIETSPPGNADWEVAPATEENAAPEFPLWRDLYGRLLPLFATVRQIDESKESPDWMERVKRASFPWEPIDLLWNVHQKQFRHEYKLQNDAYELRFGRAAPLYTRFSYLQNPETGDTVALTRSYAAPNNSVVRQVVASQLLLSLLPDFAMAVMDQNIQNHVLYQRPLNTRDNVFELNGQTLMEQAMELLSAAQTTRPTAEVRRYVSPDADWTKYAGQDKTLTPEFEALMAAKRACWDGPSATGTAFTWSLENALAPRHADAAADVPGYKRFGFRFHICCSAALCGEVEEPSDAADPLRLEGAAGAVVASEASEYEGEPVTRVIYRGLLRAAAELRCSGLMKDLWKEFVLTLAPPYLNVPHEFMTFYFDAFFGRSNCNLEQLQGQPSTTVLKDVAAGLRGKLCEVQLMLNLEQCGHFKALNVRLIHEEQSTMVSLVRCGGAKKSAAFSQAVLRAGASCFSFAASELQRYVSWYQREWQGPGSQGRYLESMKRVVECFSQMEPPLPAWLTWDWCDECSEGTRETAALVTPADCGIVDRVYATVVGQELTERNAGDVRLDERPRAPRDSASRLALRWPVCAGTTRLRGRCGYCVAELNARDRRWIRSERKPQPGRVEVADPSPLRVPWASLAPSKEVGSDLCSWPRRTQLQGTVLKDVQLMLNLEQCGHFKALNVRLIHEEQSTMVSLVRCGGAKKSAAFSQAVLRAGASCFSFAASELQRYMEPLPAWLTWDWCDECSEGTPAALVTPADCGIVDRVYATVVGQELTERNAGDDLRPATRVGASAGLFAPDYQATLGCFDCVAVTPDTDPANETPATMEVGPQPAPAVGQLGPRKKWFRTRSTRLPVEQRYYVVWLSVWDSPTQADETGGKEVFFLHQRGTTRDAAMWGLLRKALVIATSYRRMLGETVHLRRCMPPPASNGASAGADSSAELLDRAAASWGCHAVLQRMSCDSLGPWATAVEDGSQVFFFVFVLVLSIFVWRPLVVGSSWRRCAAWIRIRFLDPFAHEPDLFALFIYFFLWLELLLSQFFLSLFFFGVCVGLSFNAGQYALVECARLPRTLCGSLNLSSFVFSVRQHLWLIPRDAATRLREIQCSVAKLRIVSGGCDDLMRS
eukprot:gene8034-5589_t